MKNQNKEAGSHARHLLALALLKHGIDSRYRLLRRVAMWSNLVFVLLLLTWMAGNRYGTGYNLQDTRFSARTTDARLAEEIQRRATAYRLSIVRPDGTQEDFTLEQLGMSVDIEASIDSIRHKKYEFKTILAWWRPIQIKLIMTADTMAIKAFADHHAAIRLKDPRNATLTIKDGSVRLIDEVPGESYGLDSPSGTILDAASQLQTEPLRLKVVSVQPQITSESLTVAKTQLDNALRQPIVITVGTQQVRPSSKDIAAWIVLKPDPANKSVSIRIDSAKVQVYIDRVAYNNSYPAKAAVVLSGGRTVPGTPGVAVVSTETARVTLARELLKGKGLEIELRTVSTPFSTITAPAAGKWIEVDLTNKRLYAYDGSTLERTFLISAGAPATPTVTGTYAVYAKYTSQTMSGPNADGSSYIQPDVPWVNYFYSDYAIHGNYWRPTSYFGSVHSSHGCVGLLPSDARWVFYWAPIGTTVLVHL